MRYNKYSQKKEIRLGVVMQKEKFIKFFINRRKELGYSQSKIANEIGISDQAVSLNSFIKAFIRIPPFFFRYAVFHLPVSIHLMSGAHNPKTYKNN